MSVDPDLVDMMNAVFAEHRDGPQLWTRLDALGLVRLTGSEASGGSGAGWPEAAARRRLNCSRRSSASSLRSSTRVLPRSAVSDRALSFTFFLLISAPAASRRPSIPTAWPPPA